MLSVVVSDEGSLDVLAGLVVVPDGSGEGEQALGDADGDAEGGASTMLFKAELAFESVIDRFDALANPAEFAETLVLFFTQIRANQSGASRADEGLEFSAGVALVSNDEQSGRDL